MSPSTGEPLTGSAPSHFSAAAMPGAPQLRFTVESARVVEYAAAPALGFDLRIDAQGATVRSLSLNAQIRIAAGARAYDNATQERLRELFGERHEWSRTLRGLLWANTVTVVPEFEGSTRAQLSVPCSYDFDVAATKYLHGVRAGVIPLEFLFSGTVFFDAPDGSMHAARVPWDLEARFPLPAQLWSEMMDHYFPNSAWLRVHRQVFDKLHAFRTARGLATWDATLETLLPETDA